MSRDPIERWKDKPPGDDPEARAGALWRKAGAPRGLPPQKLERVWKRIAPAAAGAGAGISLWAWLLGGALVAVGIGGAFYLQRGAEPIAPVSLPEPKVAAVAPTPAQPPAVHEKPVAQIPAPVAKAKPRPAPERAEIAAPPPPSPAAEPESALAQESRLLQQALSQLRNGHDPGAALATLDRYAEQFPAGALADEAKIARVESLLASGERKSALEQLRTLDLERLPRGAELKVLEAEILSQEKRCREALPLFDSMVSREGELAERALHGRASCRAAEGDIAGSQADLLKYLERFPRGSFADSARAELGQ